MSKSPSLLQSWLWERRIARMKRCRTPQELVRRFGEPDHKLEQEDVAIWHYPLKVIDGWLYAIHVAVMDGSVSQVYIHISSITAPPAPPSAP